VTQAHCLPPSGPHPSVLAVATERDLDQVRADLAARLEPYKMPERIVRVEKLPRRSNGKVNTPALAAAVLTDCAPQ
jgi:acyl-coenzyme A synthetase/AMP-(fatty) acid ligase